MDTRIDSPLTLDTLDFSVDEDLFAPLPETIGLGGTGPFVINLHASSAPINPPNGDIAGCRHAYLYRIQRIEDGRMRYRLRLGPFVLEDEANTVLLHVRNDYPGALTATASVEDLSAIAKMQAKGVILQLPVEEPSVRVASVPAVADSPPSLPTAAVSSPEKSVARPMDHAPMASTAIRAPAIQAPAVQARVIQAPAVQAPAISQLLPELAEELELVEDDQPIPARAAASPTERNHPLDDADIDVSFISLSLEMPGPAVPAVERAMELLGHEVEPAPSVAAAPAFSPRPSKAPDVAAAPAFSPRPSKAPSEPAPSLESTQTLRPLTPLELEDARLLRWFVIELALSDRPYDPATVPNLDIFVLYRLYSVAGVDQGRVVHALRLGFFGEEMAARAVANYLAAYYDKPSVKRVSVAERERFADQRVEARKDIGETGKHAAIEISGEPAVPKLQITRPAAVVATPRQSFGQPAKREKPAGLFASLPWVKRRN